MYKNSVILLGIFILMLAQKSYAQAELTDSVELITIAEKRLEIGLSESSRTIDVISNEEIASLPAQSIPELLQYVAGVDVRRRGVGGVQADISIRGGTFDQTLILIDGINMSDPQTGHHLMNIPIDIEQIERIEILKGPAARIYGQNAFAGAINIVTKKNTAQELAINTSYSSYVTGRVGFMAAIPKGNNRHMVSFSKSFSEGYRYNTDYNIDNFNYQGNFEIGNDKMSVLAGYSGRAFGANGFYASPQFIDQYEEIGTSIVSLKYTTESNGWKLMPNVFWRRNQDEYIFVRSNPSIYRNLHIGNTYGSELNARKINSIGALGVGVELRIDDLASNNLGDRQRTTAGFNVEQRIILMDNKLDITPGIALFSYSDFGSRVFPGLDVGYNISSTVKMYGNIGSTWRVPTFTDLFYEDPANLGNPDLKPETALTTEIGLKFNSKSMNIQAAAFSRTSDNLIDWTKENEEAQWFPSNVGEVTIKGIEASGKLDLRKLDQPALPIINFGYTYLEGESLVDAPISRYALDLISHHFVAGVRSDLTDQVFLSVNMKYVDRLTLPTYTIVDLKAGVKINSFTVSLFVNNLLDRQYTETNLVPMPGRWIGFNAAYRG